MPELTKFVQIAVTTEPSHAKQPPKSRLFALDGNGAVWEFEDSKWHMVPSERALPRE